ncbi:MAG: gliding motility-associated protein GldE [Salinivirgaceae bacterium]
MESDPYSGWVILSALNITFLPFTLQIALGVVLTLVLLVSAAFLTGSELAFFSLQADEINTIQKGGKLKVQTAKQLIQKPHELWATILVSKSVIILISILGLVFLFRNWIIFDGSPTHQLLLELSVIAFLVFLFGVLIPRIYASQHAYKWALLMSFPLLLIQRFFKPLVTIVAGLEKYFENRYHKRPPFSINDLSNVLEYTSDVVDEDKEILKGIIEYGNIEVSEIMCPRVDVLALDIDTPFTKIIREVVDAGYSRIPIYEKTFDDVKGILYIKDLLAHINETDDFNWQSLLREPYFVPEGKKINELLNELQTDKIHLAVVVDEYGGTSGIITMEDIIEEIVGDITDEFDEDETYFSKINDNNFLFDGKTLLNDFYKIVEVENTIFDSVRGDAETLAGFILELKGEFPERYDKIKFQHFTFTIEEVDKRRIRKIKTTIKR